ncbi:alanine racemase [Kushneria marisflavi]|uniref:Alanine racemase n=1 Tax=Kushneria marisflavi TaxID=157779 RepID=A0A240USD5_9GAMM|nr:alanine racemase [Kushneria marisflavi]ART63930.1 alanine racemase [Kushneria marisflavi]RKD85649.1 alanine racemase [Kushneria marisflavi]
MRPLTAHIDLDALRHNYLQARRCAPQARAMAVLKANAYGHGAAACAAALGDLAPAMAVACLEEGQALRAHGIKCPIVLLEGFFEVSELDEIITGGYWSVLHTPWQVEALLERLAHWPQHRLTVLIKCDSGMHRLGFSPDEIQNICQRLRTHEGIEQTLLMTHFATADVPDNPLLTRQLETINTLRSRLDLPGCFANSPATLSAPASHHDWVRPGVMLYGVNPLERHHPLHDEINQVLQPVMTLESRIIAVRELPAGEPIGYGARHVTRRPTRVGVVACGYGDGYDRHAKEGTPVLVDGQRVALAGRVSMDMLTVDITELPEAGIGSRVTLWGRDASGATLSVSEVARWCDTIAYTLLTGILPRVPRCYHRSDAPKTLIDAGVLP